MTRTALILAASLATAALATPHCSRDPVSTTETTSGRLSSPTSDDTKINERDRSGAAVTPIDQSNDPSDLVMVQEIRRAVIADDTLSAMAKNVRIVTSGGVVVLRGAVQTSRERETLSSKAAAVAGDEKVVNLLEVKNP
jgi:hyperosmotically inducible protein